MRQKCALSFSKSLGHIYFKCYAMFQQNEQAVSIFNVNVVKKKALLSEGLFIMENIYIYFSAKLSYYFVFR